MTPNRREFLFMALSSMGAALIGAGCSDDASSSNPAADLADPAGGDDAGIDADANADAAMDVFEPFEAEPYQVEVVQAWFAGADLTAIRAVAAAYTARFASSEAATADSAQVLDLFTQDDTTVSALEAIDAAVLADFSIPTVISVAGWQLAATEVHMCVMADRLLV